jgi:hypothetical protein
MAVAMVAKAKTQAERFLPHRRAGRLSSSLVVVVILTVLFLIILIIIMWLVISPFMHVHFFNQT